MDCVQQPSGSKDIRTVGTVTHKINVRATDDSYQMTQQRMKRLRKKEKVSGRNSQNCTMHSCA